MPRIGEVNFVCQLVVTLDLLVGNCPRSQVPDDQTIEDP